MLLCKLEFSRAHTPRASAASDLYPASSLVYEPDLCTKYGKVWLNLELEYVDDLYLHIVLNYCAHEQKAHGLQLIGMANKNSICDTRGTCQTIWSIVKPVFSQFRQFRCTYESLRWLDVLICWFLWRLQTARRPDKTDRFTPCACAHGAITMIWCSNYCNYIPSNNLLSCGYLVIMT